MNIVVLHGNLGRDCEVKHTQSGTAICTNSIAVTRQFKQGETTKEKTTWVEFTIWGARGEAFAKFHGKGSKALLDGHLELDEWDDKATGQKRTKLKLVVDDWEFVGARRDAAPAGDAAAPAPAEDTPF
jgi:single-strand DNA-binding protein